MPFNKENPTEKEKITPSFKESTLKKFKNFLARPDEPKYSYKEQHELAGKKESEKEFLESKGDKKHISAIWAPLLYAKLFLESEEANYISKIEKEELLNKIADLIKELAIARQQENISDEFVKKVTSFIEELEACIK